MPGNTPNATLERLTPSQAGRLGARRRWGDQRVVRLDSLHPAVAAAIRALVAADQAAREEAAPDVETGTADGGGTRDAASA